MEYNSQKLFKELVSGRLPLAADFDGKWLILEVIREAPEGSEEK